jgi:hypothetical protein
MKPILKRWIDPSDLFSWLVVLTRESTILSDGDGFVNPRKRVV